LRSTITNGAEDLSGCDVFFVVGGANITLKGQLDPLSQVQIMDAMRADMSAGGVYSREMAQAPGGQPAASRPASDQPEGSGWVAGNVTGEGYGEMSEFFFYKKSGLTLRVGDVAMLNVFTKPIKYRSFFEWRSGDAFVQRHLMVRNDSDAPFTTGPVLAVRDGKPLSQITMKFTPVGTEEKAATFMATDVQCRAGETELERGPVEHFSGYDYIPVKMDGKIAIVNNRPTEIEILVHHQIVGKNLELDGEGKVVSTQTQDLNSRIDVEWKVKVPAHQTHELTYHMTRYVRATTG
jgi:hypothetical protein